MGQNDYNMRGREEGMEGQRGGRGWKKGDGYVDNFFCGLFKLQYIHVSSRVTKAVLVACVYYCMNVVFHWKCFYYLL